MRAFFFLAIAAAFLAGLFFLFKPGRLVDESPLAPAPAAPPAAKASSSSPLVIGKVEAPVAAPAAAAPREVDMVVKGGRLVSGDATIKLRQGDELTLRVTSDKADELHLHGYDMHMHLRAGAPATLKIRADRTGRFPLELHKSHFELGTLEVYPR
jgi:hypothetical protein